MGEMLLVYWLVLVTSTHSSGSAMVVLPVPYQTLEQCNAATEAAHIGGYCVPQPRADVAKFLYSYSNSGAYRADHP